jgi:quercetin dioxygenase-like cupin family protein
MKFNGKSKKSLAIVLVVAAAIIAAGVALAAATVLVENAVTVNHGTFKSDRGLIKLKTKGPVRMRDVSNTAVPPGIVGNWHTHPGPVIVAMTDSTNGTLTFYGEDCQVLATIQHGQSFIEKPNEPLFVRNNSTSNVDWVTTMIMPPGLAHTVFLNPPPPPCT